MHDFRSDFPIFQTSPLIYLDSAATSQKPKVVIDRVSEYLSLENANIHRGGYALADRASELFSESKKQYQKYIKASENIHTSYSANATHAINEIALMIEASKYITPGDHILIQRDNHHANIVPWMILAQKIGARIDWLDLSLTEDIHRSLTDAVTPSTRIIALTHASNVSGAYYDWYDLTQYKGSALTIIDASQSLAHGLIDMSHIQGDFVVTTAHKCYALTGLGAYSAPKDLLRSLTPGIGGGGAINFVRSTGFEFAGLPFRHEPGTPHVVGAVSLGCALGYLEMHHNDHMSHEKNLIRHFEYLYDIHLSSDFDIIAPVTPDRIGVFSLLPKKGHIRDYSDYLDSRHIAVRSGQHCCEPLYESIGKTGALRVSLGIYTTTQDLENLTDALLTAKDYV